MSDERIEQSIRSAAASVEMEGFQIDASYLELCRRLLAGELTMEQYIIAVSAKGRA